MVLTIKRSLKTLLLYHGSLTEMVRLCCGFQVIGNVDMRRPECSSRPGISVICSPQLGTWFEKPVNFRLKRLKNPKVQIFVILVFIARCTIVQSAVLPLHVVRPSVRLSVCDVGGSGSHRLEILETNCTHN